MDLIYIRRSKNDQTTSTMIPVTSKATTILRRETKRKSRNKKIAQIF